MSASALIRTKGIRCNLQRRTQAKDAAGSVTWTWGNHISGIKVFVQPASGAESIRYGRESNRNFVIGYCLARLDVRPADQLTGGQLGTRVLDIQSVRLAGEFTSGPLSHQVLEMEETS